MTLRDYFAWGDGFAARNRPSWMILSPAKSPFNLLNQNRAGAVSPALFQTVMSPDHQYYLVTGDPLLSLLQKYEEEVELSAKLYNELVKEFDFMGRAVGTWGDFDGIVALQFDYGQQPADGWVRYSVTGQKGFWKPSSKTPEGKAMIERLRKIRSEGTRLLQFIVSGNASGWMFMLSNLRGMVLGYEKIGTAFVFCYPVPPNGTKWACSGADRWQMPEEGVKLLSKGAYYQLLADHERTNLPA